jgi:hypothetical protein
MPTAESSIALIRTAHRPGGDRSGGDRLGDDRSGDDRLGDDRSGAESPTRDRVYVGSASIVVLDGVPRNDHPSGRVSGGGDLADRLGVELMARLETVPAVDLVDALRDSEAVVGFPALPVAIVRWSTMDVEALVIGAGPVVVQIGEQVQVVRDGRARWPQASVAGAMVMTDGSADGVDVYGVVPDWSSAYRIAVDNPQAYVDLVHAAEESDPDCHRWPRPMRHSDKVLAVVAFSG